MLLNEQFVDMHLEMRGGKLGLDFTHFDDTVCATGELVTEYEASPHLRGMPMPEVQHYMQHMRHYTFRRLTDQRGPAATASKARGVAPVAAAATAAASHPGALGSGAPGSAGIEMVGPPSSLAGGGGGAAANGAPTAANDLVNPFADQSRAGAGGFSTLNL